MCPQKGSVYGHSPCRSKAAMSGCAPACMVAGPSQLPPGDTWGPSTPPSPKPFPRAPEPPGGLTQVSGIRVLRTRVTESSSSQQLRRDSVTGVNLTAGPGGAGRPPPSRGVPQVRRGQWAPPSHRSVLGQTPARQGSHLARRRTAAPSCSPRPRSSGRRSGRGRQRWSGR